MTSKVLARFKSYFHETGGAVAVEYVVIASAITLAIIPGFYYVSSAVTDQLTFITSFVMGA